MIKSAFQIFGDCISTCISCNSGFGVPDDIFRGSIPLTQMNQTQPPNQITTNQSSNTTTLMKPTDSTSAVVFGGGANESDSDDSEISAFVQDTQQPAEIIDERLGELLWFLVSEIDIFLSFVEFGWITTWWPSIGSLGIIKMA